MRPVQSLTLALLTLAISALSGCYQMYGGNPYGAYPYGASPYGAAPYGAAPYGQPGMYQPGVQTLTPGAPYVPGGSTVPGSAPPSTFGNGGGLQPIPNNNNNAPGYNGNEVNVPDPYMRPSTSTQFPPANNGIQPVSGNSMLEPAPLQPLSGDLREVRQATPTATAAAPFGNTMQPAASANPFPGSTAQAEPANEFFAPVQSNTPPAANDSPFVPRASNPPAAQDIFGAELRKVDVSHVEFGHEPEFRWLQGYVSKDEDGTWSITFDDNPSPEATHGGNFPLADSPAIAHLKDGQFVRLTGDVDPVVKDAHGKPMYVISSVAERTAE